jgi:MFS transporter, DHA1 family, multidrug resistance protein
MAAEFGATPAALQLTLTAALVGSALGQLVIGPLADRYGRRGAILLGTALCVLATVACAAAPSGGCRRGPTSPRGRRADER